MLPVLFSWGANLRLDKFWVLSPTVIHVYDVTKTRSILTSEIELQIKMKIVYAIKYTGFQPTTTRRCKIIHFIYLFY